MDLHRFWDGVITSSSNFKRLINEATALRNRAEFSRSQLTELARTDFESLERLGAAAIATLDLRHFGAMKINGAPALLPRDA